MTTARAWNRLASEKSPYLLQHASNPVNWYPWGEEAFEKALREDKPIFLSIGYSTCHWCHVMERESFEQADVGRILSDDYVAIKVDREERPDVDQIYMAVCQALTGSGGWPLTVILTPDRRPFFAGTYFPPESRFGRPGLKELLYQILSAWEQQREHVVETAEKIVVAVQPQFSGNPGGDLDEATLRLCFEQLASRFDGSYGGFGTAPKFPTPHVLTFLLRWWQRSGDSRALEMVETSLQAMRRGGLYDQIGFGFHRYSTDREWLVPHFEKMLYDQALILIAYVEAFQATRNAIYGAVAREVAAYVLRAMTSPDGAFYSAEDADSEGEEGSFYLWRRSEIETILGPDEAALYCRVFHINPDGNWRDAATDRTPDTNIPHAAGDSSAVAGELGIETGELARRLEAARQALFTARERRIHPHKDDKILTGWNGLMIAALAKAARAFDEPAYFHAAESALSFLMTKVVREDGRLLARYRDGEAAHPAYLDDHAFLAWGLLELYEATFSVCHFDAALKLAREMERLFWDDHDGGFYFTGNDGEVLLARAKEIYDGATPSGNSVAALVFLRLGRMTGDASFERRVDALFHAFSGTVARAPSAHAQLLAAVDFAIGPTSEIVITAESDNSEVREMTRAVNERFLPRKVVLLNAPGERNSLVALAPPLALQTAVGGKAAAYVCENYTCRAPITSAGELARLLDAPIPRAAP